MSAARPLWRKGFDTLERGIGQPLEQLVNTDQFVVALAFATTAQRKLRRRLGRLQQRALHLGNIPAWSDVAQLVSQIDRLERRVIALSEQLEHGADRSKKQPDS